MLPANEEIERMVVGYALLEPERIPDLTAVLRADDFLNPQNRRVFTEMVHLYEDQGYVDRVMVASSLYEAGEKDILSFLVDIEGLPPNCNIERHIDKLKAYTLRRNLMNVGHHLELNAALSDADGNELAEIAQKRIRDAQDRSASTTKLWDTPETVVEASGGIRSYLTQQPKPGLTTPWNDLNSLLIGLQPGDMFVVGARPSVGKTVVGLQIAQHNAQNGHRTAYFSLEMLNRPLIDRMIAEVAEVPGLRVRDRSLTRAELERAESIYPALKIPLYLFDTPVMRTVSGIRAGLRQITRDEGPVEMVVIDHFLLMDSPGRSESHRLMLSGISHALKFLAKEMKLVVVLLAQLNRNAENERRPPIMSDLKETGTLEEDADEIMLIHRPGATRLDDQSLRGIADFILAKNRNGPVGVVPMAYRDNIPRFDMRAIGEYR